MGPNNFSVLTSDQSSRQNANFLFTQWDDVSLNDLNSSLYQFDNPLPHVLSQESECVSGVYPVSVFSFQEQLGETVETSLQLGPEIQTFELHANGPGHDQVREYCKRNHRVSELIRLAYHY